MRKTSSLISTVGGIAIIENTCNPFVTNIFSVSYLPAMNHLALNICKKWKIPKIQNGKVKHQKDLQWALAVPLSFHCPLFHITNHQQACLEVEVNIQCTGILDVCLIEQRRRLKRYHYLLLLVMTIIKEKIAKMDKNERNIFPSCSHAV